MAEQSPSVVSVVIDSIDMTALANNVISHMVKKRDSRVDDQKLKRAGGVTTLDDLKDEETEADTVDGPGSPYQYQRAPSRSGEDVTDSPGYRTGGGRRSKIRAVTDVMLRVADELDSNEEMWSLFSKLDLTPDTAYDTFREVAMGIFTHGVSWGKIAVLFMFAAHCVIKAVLSELPNILLMLASFVAQFFGESLRQWIEDHGGWSALTDPAKNPLLLFGTFMVVGLASGVVLKVLYDRYFS